MIRISLLTIALSFSIAACGDDPVEDSPDAGGGNVCDTSTLTYGNFGQQFFTDYCTECHSTTSQSRLGAPSSINFDDYALVNMNQSRSKARAGTTSSMPPSTFPNSPSAAERADLVEWIDCGLAEN